MRPILRWSRSAAAVSESETAIALSGHSSHPEAGVSSNSATRRFPPIATTAPTATMALSRRTSDTVRIRQHEGCEADEREVPEDESERPELRVVRAAERADEPEVADRCQPPAGAVRAGAATSRRGPLRRTSGRRRSRSWPRATVGPMRSLEAMIAAARMASVSATAAAMPNRRALTGAAPRWRRPRARPSGRTRAPRSTRSASRSPWHLDWT